MSEENNDSEAKLSIPQVKGKKVVQTIDSTGGDLSIEMLNGGLTTLTIPSGALEEATEISIQQMTETDAIKNGLYFQPSGLIFQQPVTIELDISNDQSTNTQLVWFDDNGSIQPIDSVQLGNKLSAEVVHFSSYGTSSTSEKSSLCVWTKDHEWVTGCTLKGMWNDEISWGITEFGLDIPYTFISVNLINKTSDIIFVKNMYYTSIENYLGKQQAGSLRIHLPEKDYNFQAQWAKRSKLNSVSEIQAYWSQVGGYNPSYGGPSLIHEDESKAANFEFCVDWVRFNETGIVSENSNCLAYESKAIASSNEIPEIERLCQAAQSCDGVTRPDPVCTVKYEYVDNCREYSADFVNLPETMYVSRQDRIDALKCRAAALENDCNIDAWYECPGGSYTPENDAYSRIDYKYGGCAK